MRLGGLISLIFVAASAANAQSDRDFSGVWQLNPARSDIRDFSTPPARTLSVEQNASGLTVSITPEPGVPPSIVVCPLDGSSRKSKVNDSTWNVASKWEGASLLLNIIVSGQTSDYSLFERWTRSRDGNRLTITRTVNRRGVETESVLAYENPNAVSANPPEQISSASRPGGSPEISRPVNRLREPSPMPPPVSQDNQYVDTQYVVKSGTRILMRLTNAVNTKKSVVGDMVYLQTAAPIFVNSRMVIPVGSYVTGSITESQRAGRVKGRSELNLRFETVTLPNGVTRDFRARAGSVDSKGNLDRSEGKIEGEGKAGSGSRTVATTTAAGAGIGTIAGAAAGHLGAGLGIGAAAGAAAGLAGVLGTRGADVVIPQGTSIEMVLDRDLVFTSEDLRGRVQ